MLIRSFLCYLIMIIAVHSVTILGLVTWKPVFRVSEKARLKTVSSATETCYNIEITLIACLDKKKLSFKQITKPSIRLRRCAGWSAPLLFAKPKDMFSRIEAHL